MKYEKHQEGWYAMATLKELKRKKPIRRFLFSTPIVLFFGETEPVAMIDRCPHRGAKLSDGNVRNGTIQCPYHGWVFEADGQLSHMPCLPLKVPAVKHKTFETYVQFGLVFIRLGNGSKKPYQNPLTRQIKFWRPMPGGAKSNLVDTAENFLDPTHTIFVHKQLFYNVKNSALTRVIVHGDDNMVEINYYGGGGSGGLIGKVMREKERAKSVGRFILPNVAEVEFHSSKGVNFVMTGFITPANNEVEGYGVVGIPGPIWWAWVKFILLYPWIKLVHKQDKMILKKTSQNQKHFDGYKNLIGPLDVMRPQIEALTQGRPPPAKDTPFECQMKL